MNTTKNKTVNKSILSWLMGLSMLIAAPAAMADRVDHKQGSQKHSYKQNQKQSHAKKHMQTKRVVKTHKPSQKHFHKHQQVKNHGWQFTISNNKPYYSSHRYKQSKRNKFAYHSKQIRKRQANQNKRIRKGIQKGQLVRFERKELRQQQRHIANRIANYSSDGRLNRHERTKINKMLDRASNNIRNKKHNRFTRYNSHRNHKKTYIAYNR